MIVFPLRLTVPENPAVKLPDGSNQIQINLLPGIPSVVQPFSVFGDGHITVRIEGTDPISGLPLVGQTYIDVGGPYYLPLIPPVSIDTEFVRQGYFDLLRREQG